MPLFGWTGRLSAFAAAAMVVLTLGAVLLPVATVRSTAVLAAQLALDHLKCFTIDGDADGAADRAAPSRSDADARLRFFGDRPGVAAGGTARVAGGAPLPLWRRPRGALVYRVNGEPVSLFILPGLTRPAAELSLFGHDEVVWTQGDRTYMLVARGGLASDLARVASYLRTEAK